MLTIILQLTLGIGFVVMVCFLAYKVVLPACLKIIDICFKSNLFRLGVCIFLALIFCGFGVLQLKDYREEIEHGMSRFFPLSFLASGIFLFLIFWKVKK
jgi:hypothetical protein